MRIIKNPKEPSKFCMFCKNKLDGNIFCQIDFPEIIGRKRRTDEWTKEWRKYKYEIHLSCGLTFLKKLQTPSIQDKKLIEILETNYAKQRIAENL